MTEQLKISNSSIKTLLRCEQQYDYKFVQLLEPRRPAIPLRKGNWLHALLEHRYREGDWRPEHRRLTREFNKMFEEERAFYGDLPGECAQIMKGYDYHWRDDTKEWKIVETEMRVELALGSSWLYVAKLDVVAENDEGLWVWDHKTFRAKAPSSDYRTTDPQSALYDWAYERLTGEKPKGFVFNYIRTKLPTQPKLLKAGGISKAKNIDTNWYTLARFLKENDLDPADYREQLSAAKARDTLFYDRVYIPKPVPVIKNLLSDIQEKAPRIRALHEGARPTRTLTRECQYGCAYHLLCLTEMVGGDGSYIKKHDFNQREGFDYYDEPATIEE